MRISTAFPSDYLKAADLQGRRITVKIARVEMRDVGDDTKPVLYFEDKDKGLVLNKTNANTISSAHGDETKDWEGQEIVLFETAVDFQGKRVAAIRCIVPPRKLQTSSAEVIPDDDMPF
jgi:hypothetical protein